MDKGITELLSTVSSAVEGMAESCDSSPPPSELDRLIDHIIPRGGRGSDSIHVSLEEYLARVASLHRKISGTRYRVERWREVCSKHEARFAAMTDPDALDLQALANDLPEGGTASFTLTLQDQKVESELEALLASMRSTLDHLARVVACFSSGHTDVHRYTKVVTLFGADDPISKLVSVALAGWAGDLKARRDELTHYVAAVVISVQQSTFSTTSAETTQRVAGIRNEVQKRSVPVWYSALPVVGGTRHSSVAAIMGAETIERHSIYDSRGGLIFQHIGTIPQHSCTSDSRVLGEEMYKEFIRHLSDVLELLATRL